jgi:putative restriction endonuclease
MQGWIAVVPSTDALGATRTSWTAYTYETDDRSKKQIAPNDLLFLRDQTRLLAVARIESVTTEKREQMVAKCPVCGLAKVEVRKKSDMPYRCFHGHQFLAPVEVPQATLIHTAHFDHDCVRIVADIEPAEVRPFELTNSRHVKLKTCDISGMCGYVARRDHTVSPTLKSWLRHRTVDLGDRDGDATSPLSFSISDEQERPFHAIRLRRGAAAFRDKLITRYGPRCMISGCSVLALLEACHVGRYQGPDDNHPTNGLLLRSDLHTLFDLDLIGLNPADMEVTIHDKLVGTEYEKYAGTRLMLGGEKGIDARAVRARWEQFMRKAVGAAYQMAFVLVGLGDWYIGPALLL